jgi:hypothetical protein
MMLVKETSMQSNKRLPLLVIPSARADMACLLLTSMHFASTITGPAYNPSISATSCSCDMGLVSSCIMMSYDL